MKLEGQILTNDRATSLRILELLPHFRRHFICIPERKPLLRMEGFRTNTPTTPSFPLMILVAFSSGAKHQLTDPTFKPLQPSQNQTQQPTSKAEKPWLSSYLS